MSMLARRTWGDDTKVELQDFAWGESGVSFGKRSAAQELLSFRGPITKRLSDFDMVLDSGAGDSFTDAYGFKRLLLMVYVQSVAHRLGIPVVFGPQTIGPFSTRIGQMLARRAISRVACIVTRDSVSAEAVARLARPADAISTDVVFALPQVPVEKTRDVIFNVSGLLWPPNHHVDNLAYQRAVRSSIKDLLNRGRRVTLLAHVVGPDVPINEPGAGDNDVPPLKLLEREYGGDSSLEFLAPPNLTVARVILGSGRLVIGSRMHACLNALSMGTPAIPLAYSRKFEPLLRDIGWNHIIDLRETPDFSCRLSELLDDMTLEGRLLEQLPISLAIAQSRLEEAVSTLRRIRP
ncbi:polysaccharide pyruvyl transferase WcaK-like protein [Mycobacterium sp. OAS707]|uniref:polysaccharide pyruvyl transferase family protein n=1 Tax=Mycobacterium sp. OAS707 TaxID=2663822 RepID=UPI00178AF7A1|nr:polysaccharide pyruvyl transferase family protein [Mycobacterium sp. OAS707]MBE1547992.1 polysaccharide pyruvyl transferase WcaK-like protein [Mycobacterium sp. OAS707]